MQRTRFVKSPEEVDRLLSAYARPDFLDIHSLAVTFDTDPEVVRELLPPPLEPSHEARISISVYEVRRSSCVGPFNGSSVNIACRYGGEEGLYCLAMPMNTDTAIIFGRELYAEPKKLAEIALSTRPGHAHGTVMRHGVTYIELDGHFEDEPAEVGRESLTKHYYFKYLPAANGAGLAADPELVCVTHRGLTHRAVRGTGSITFRESRHDPVIDIPVWSVTGASLSESETHTTAEVVARVPAATFLPYAFAKSDDYTAWSAETC